MLYFIFMLAARKCFTWNSTTPSKLGSSKNQRPCIWICSSYSKNMIYFLLLLNVIFNSNYSKPNAINWLICFQVLQIMIEHAVWWTMRMSRHLNSIFERIIFYIYFSQAPIKYKSLLVIMEKLYIAVEELDLSPTEGRSCFYFPFNF